MIVDFASVLLIELLNVLMQQVLVVSQVVGHLHSALNHLQQSAGLTLLTTRDIADLELVADVGALLLKKVSPPLIVSVVVEMARLL